MKSNIDIKTIFIFVLAGVLILSFIFRPSSEINTHEEELKQLQVENAQLKESNKGLKSMNEGLNLRIDKLITDIDSTQSALANTEGKLNDLEDGKGKVSGYVKSLDANGVAESFNQYLERKKN